MTNLASSDDRLLRDEFEALVFPKSEFRHRQHLQLAYVYVCEGDTGSAHERMRAALLAFIAHHAIDPAKYNETLTMAWILAVRHFMEKTPGTTCFEELVARNPVMLDSRIMHTHYTADRLHSAAARGLRRTRPRPDPALRAVEFKGQLPGNSEARAGLPDPVFGPPAEGTRPASRRRASRAHKTPCPIPNGLACSGQRHGV